MAQSLESLAEDAVSRPDGGVGRSLLDRGSQLERDVDALVAAVSQLARAERRRGFFGWLEAAFRAL